MYACYHGEIVEYDGTQRRECRTSHSTRIVKASREIALTVGTDGYLPTTSQPVIGYAWDRHLFTLQVNGGPWRQNYCRLP